MMCFGLKERKRLKTNHCVIVLLDDTQLVHELHASSTGQDLLDVVIKHLNLLETSYFGLRYFESPPAAASLNNNNNNKDYYQLDCSTAATKQQQVWLDVDRSAIKQLRNVQPMTVYFGVKYYAPDPCKLAEEITRYQFFLQCKQDILQGRLAISFELAVELFALAVQSELGDYDPQRHQENYVGEFQFLPASSLTSQQQLLELELRVAQLHRQLSGQVPATAELNFLERVKWLDLYGCELHPIQYDESPPPPPSSSQQSGNSSGAAREDEQYALGLNPSGVSVLRNRLKVAHYVWPRIVKTKCQGRCFLMDVVAAAATSPAETSSRGGHNGGRQRFGFRLADKLASRRLRWALEQHKSFYHLINNNSHSAALSQRQRLGQRFRHSIRSAIHLGAGSSAFQQQQQQQLIVQQQQQLRSSMKSAANGSRGGVGSGGLMATGGGLELARQPPAVVRMPSRRYSQRSMAPPAAAIAAARQQQQQVANGLPIQQHAHTMLDHQRQQALIMMSQMNAASQQQQAQFNHLLGARNSAAAAAAATKSQTLRPVSSKQAAANREKNQYYHQMMMAMMANQQQQQQQQQPLASIYKASSVINNINQLGLESAAQSRNGGGGKATSVMQQLFSRPAAYQYNSQRLVGGHESPRSTKSAIAPSSALKLASKKLARQQQLLFSQLQAQDAQPLLAYEAQQQQQQLYSNYYGPGGLATAFNVSAIGQNNNCNSANGSPRSARSARLTSSRHKSKSINENLHLLHLNQQQQLNRLPLPPQPANANRMLLATATQLMQHQRPPPPNYEGNVRLAAADFGVKYSDNESELSKLSLMDAKRHNGNHLARKRATFALSNEQANRLLLSANNNNNNNIEQHQKLAAIQKKLAGGMRIVANEDDEADYCCSRSDCSSLEDRNFRPPNRRTAADQKKLSARMELANSNLNSNSHSHSHSKQQLEVAAAAKQRDWNSIRRRHEDFSRGKGFQMGNNFDHPDHDDGDDDDDAEANSNDANNNNNNSRNSSQLVKNIANKQATPILLSMNYQQQQQQQLADGAHNRTSVNNSKAVQLLNSQRRQLNSCGSSSSNQSSMGGADSNEAAVGNKFNNGRSTESAASSAASSPQNPAAAAAAAAAGLANNSNGGLQQASSKTADSTVSNSSSTTTSGYYAGSNSTGSASADSDNTQTNENHPNKTRRQQQQQQPPAGSRAKIALGSHAATRMSGDRLLIGNQAHFKACVTSEREANDNNNNNNGSNSLLNGRATQTSKQFYLGCEQPAKAAANSENSSTGSKTAGAFQAAAAVAGQWSPLSQIQQHPNASLKYVSFDV